MLNPSACLSVRQSVNEGMVGSVCVWSIFFFFWACLVREPKSKIENGVWNGVVELSRIEYLAFEHYSPKLPLPLIIHHSLVLSFGFCFVPSYSVFLLLDF